MEPATCSFEENIKGMGTEIENKLVVTSDKEQTFHTPCITLLLPLDKKDNNAHLQALAMKIEKELTDQYNTGAKQVIERLHRSLSNIDLDSSKKSVAIFLSSIYEKMIYLDIPLEEKVIIDEAFEIRDLVNNRYPADKYLVLVQSARHFQFFLGDRYHLMKIKVNIPDDIAAYKNDIAEKIENFSDTTGRKEIMLDKFIRHIDKELESILKKYKLPVFVIGSERMNGHFKKYTHNENAILDYIHGNYDDAKPHQLLHLIQPYLKELKEIETKELTAKIEYARNANKFCSGIYDVWRNVMDRKGHLLLVEKNYTFPYNDDGEENELTDSISDIYPVFLKDAVDIIIERVLESGGEVKFVDAGIIKDYRHIALTLYY